jgi:hypothetical protein
MNFLIPKPATPATSAKGAGVFGSGFTWTMGVTRYAELYSPAASAAN